jgi:hypothetical protein
MRVEVEIEETTLQGEYRDDIPGLLLTCSRCGHEVEVFGTEAASARRGAMMLREECPNKEKNFYWLKDWTGEAA